MDVKQYIVEHEKKFSNLIAKNQGYGEIMMAYLRATTETLIDGHMGAGPTNPKQPRKPRGPNKKKQPGVETDSGTTD